MNTTISPDNYEIFFDRELSWIDFNLRVLDEARNISNPILERLKFLSISESNLDEFYMVRVAGVRERLLSGFEEKGLTGLSSSEILKEISVRVADLVNQQYDLLNSNILPELVKNNIHLIQNTNELKRDDIAFLKIYYKEEVSDILTPLAIDKSHPFPHILNKSLNLAITLNERDDKSGRDLFAMVQVPSVLPRFIELPRESNQRRFFPLERIIELHLSDLFYGMQVKEINAFKIIRDSDISIREDNTGDLLSTVKKELKNRTWGDAVHLYVSQKTPPIVKTILREALGLEDYEIMEVSNIINLTDLMYFYNLSDFTNLKFPSIVPKNIMSEHDLDRVFSIIRKGDLLFHHPYDTFQAVEDLLKFASLDPKVLAIKMTLYRTSGDSPIIQYLKQAAENGKQVTVLVELKARFDEERNIMWAQRLEDSGVHVVYGVVGMKVHCKMLLIVRRETDKLRRYVHLSTGNYNSATAKFYTDLSLFTKNEEITDEVSSLFNVMTSFAKMPKFKTLSVAPLYLRDDVITFILREAEIAKKGEKGYIFMKMNSLVDPDVVLALYEASCAGVKVDLVVRGICCLKPGIPGLSENISVRSIVGRFLEHSRIYMYHNKGHNNLYLASADCMPRNFYKRIEVMFPITDSNNKKRIFKIIDLILKDNVKARLLGSDGVYSRINHGDVNPVDSQVELQKA
jgi:polyphosphate kinase